MKANLGLAARLLVGAAFIYSGFSKAVAPPQEFAAVLEAYYLLPSTWLMPMATILPWAQLIFGTFLVAGYLTRASAAVLGALLLSFFGAIAYAKSIGVPLTHCGCFADIRLTPTQTMILDSVLFALVVTAYRHGREQLSLDRWIGA